MKTIKLELNGFIVNIKAEGNSFRFWSDTHEINIIGSRPNSILFSRGEEVVSNWDMYYKEQKKERHCVNCDRLTTNERFCDECTEKHNKKG